MCASRKHVAALAMVVLALGGCSLLLDPDEHRGGSAGDGGDGGSGGSRGNGRDAGGSGGMGGNGGSRDAGGDGGAGGESGTGGTNIDPSQWSDNAFGECCLEDVHCISGACDLDKYACTQSCDEHDDCPPEPKSGEPECGSDGHCEAESETASIDFGCIDPETGDVVHVDEIRAVAPVTGGSGGSGGGSGGDSGDGGSGGTSATTGAYDIEYDCVETLACSVGAAPTAVQLDLCIALTTANVEGLDPSVLALLDETFMACSDLTACDYVDCVSGMGLAPNGGPCSEDSDCQSNNCGSNQLGEMKCYGNAGSNEECAQVFDCNGGLCLPNTVERARAGGEGIGVCSEGISECFDLNLSSECQVYVNLFCAHVQTCGGSTLWPEYNDFDVCIATECRESSSAALTTTDCETLSASILGGILPCL